MLRCEGRRQGRDSLLVYPADGIRVTAVES